MPRAQYLSGADIPVLFMHVGCCIPAFRGTVGGNRPLSFIKPDEVGHDVVAGEYSLLCEVEPSVVDSYLP